MKPAPFEYVAPRTLDEVLMRAVGGFKAWARAGVSGAVPSLTNAVADALAGLGVNVNSTPLASASSRARRPLLDTRPSDG